jgi:methylenetetrahydrofolate reductase (NADPH)
MDARAMMLLRGCSIELSPRDAFAGPALRGLLASGTLVFVNNPPSVTQGDIVAACKRLTGSGFSAVPHVVVRRLASFTDASDFLSRLAGEAGVEQMLLLGGDVPRPTGPFVGAFDLLSTGVVERRGIHRIAFAGYPEGHPHITSATLEAALLAKVELAQTRGLEVSLVTQFGFEAEPIVAWIAAQRARGILCPVRIGLAGPASVATLAKYAVRCGIGASLRALGQRHAAFARILTEANPGGLIETISQRLGDDTTITPHVFSFGGVRRTVEWLHQ